MKQPKKDEPVAIDLYALEHVFRALANASMAIDKFNNQQNYGPAIQQLILDLSEVYERLEGECDSFEAAKLFKVAGDLSGWIEDRNIDFAELMHGDIYLWEESTPEARRNFYKARFPWDHDLNPDEALADGEAEPAGAETVP